MDATFPKSTMMTQRQGWIRPYYILHSNLRTILGTCALLEPEINSIYRFDVIIHYKVSRRKYNDVCFT